LPHAGAFPDLPVTNRNSAFLLEEHTMNTKSINIYVGNLQLGMTEDELRQEFTVFVVKWNL